MYIVHQREENMTLFVCIHKINRHKSFIYKSYHINLIDENLMVKEIQMHTCMLSWYSISHRSNKACFVEKNTVTLFAIRHTNIETMQTSHQLYHILK